MRNACFVPGGFRGLGAAESWAVCMPTELLRGTLGSPGGLGDASSQALPCGTTVTSLSALSQPVCPMTGVWTLLFCGESTSHPSRRATSPLWGMCLLTLVIRGLESPGWKHLEECCASCRVYRLLGQLPCASPASQQGGRRPSLQCNTMKASSVGRNEVPGTKMPPSSP